ncbi:MAG: ATP-binding cassette domain-containing protein, partial [Thermotogota bacterium]
MIHKGGFDLPNVLDLKGVGKSYYGTKVLNDINISVSPGEIHALAGENGAGKSTLMNILFGMPVIHETG